MKYKSVQNSNLNPIILSKISDMVNSNTKYHISETSVNVYNELFVLLGG